MMFSDSTRGDISPSDLGSGAGSGDDDFTMFDTGFFTGSTVDVGSTTVEEDASPFSGVTTEGKSGTTEFGTEMTESSDITEETDVTFEGSGTTIEETSPEEGSGASTFTDAFTEESTMEATEASTAESGSTSSSSTIISTFKSRQSLPKRYNILIIYLLRHSN